MAQSSLPPTISADGLTLRPLRATDLDALAVLVREPGVREWWGCNQESDHVLDGLRNGGGALAIEADEQLIGWLGYEEEHEPDYRHARLDIFLAPAYQDRGLGRKALRLIARWLLEDRGHHRLTIDPARANARAIRAYEAVGFRAVGVMRDYERGADGRWRDGLLMDLLADELRLSDEPPQREPTS